MLCCCHTLLAQKTEHEGLTLTRLSSGKIAIEYRLQTIKASQADKGYLTLSSRTTNSYSHDAGKAMLPECRKLIALPTGCNIEVSIEKEEWDTLSLKGIGRQLPLMPYSGAKPKETFLQPTFADSIYYTTDSLMGAAVISIHSLGIMRSTRIGLLGISPVKYNPVAGTVAVCRRLSATLTISGGEHSNGLIDNPLTHAIPLCSPLSPKDYVNTLAQDSLPQGYLVVSTTGFRETLQPLIRWKRQEGYLVDELYFEHGNTNTVKDSLQRRYDNATESHPAPLFILIVGDMQHIQMWSPNHLIQGLESHRTDFYYSEFTGDMLPDAIVGRISVQDTVQLHHVIEKTIAYEKGDIADTAALRRSLLVAGMEETHPAPIVTNGQVNYIKQLLTNYDPGHDTVCYYNPESANQREDILNAIREGVGLMNYTSHCTSRGWRNPMLTNNDINNNDIFDSHPLVAVNNCCRSNDIAGECFGEMLLRKETGGAVAAIGASNETLWEEDYYWSVGFGAITTTPDVDSCDAGAFDRLLHPHIQPFAEQAWTIGQMLVAGNSAVEASGSEFAGFYWEIYLLLGDPSLMPQIGELHTLQLECDSVRLGDAGMTLHGTPWTRVAVTCGDTLMGRCTLDANGDGEIHFTQPVASDVYVTATKQFHRAKQLIYNLIDDSSSNAAIDIIDDNNISIFPNPSTGRVTVKGLAEPTTVRVYDAMGRLLFEKEIADAATLELPKGINILTFGNSGKRKIVRVKTEK